MKSLASIFFCLLMPIVQAANVKCVGMSYQGTMHNLILDKDANKLLINGDVFNIVRTKDGNMFVTNSFVNTGGEYVFDIFLYKSTIKSIKNKSYIAQYNAATGKFLRYIELSCHE